MEQQKAFDKAKDKISKAPVLIIHNPELLATVKTDILDFIIGAELSQPGPNGRLWPIAYYSRKIIQAELNYNIHNKELLAIIIAF